MLVFNKPKVLKTTLWTQQGTDVFSGVRFSGPRLMLYEEQEGPFLQFDNNKLDPDGWLVAGHILNCTKKIEKQDAERKNAQATMKLQITQPKKYCFFASEKGVGWTGAFEWVA